jgi:hypothetical protein
MLMSPMGLRPEKGCSGDARQKLKSTDPTSRQRGRPTSTNPKLSKNIQRENGKNWSLVPGPKVHLGIILSSERVPHFKKPAIVRQKTKIWSWAPDGSPTPRQTGRLTVGLKLTSTSVLPITSCFSKYQQLWALGGSFNLMAILFRVGYLCHQWEAWIDRGRQWLAPLRDLDPHTGYTKRSY